MKTLFLHPKDASTRFLSPLHYNFPDKTLISEGHTHATITDRIKSHDTIIAMGHGSPGGLFAVGQFNLAGLFVLSQEHTEILRAKQKNVFIWCYAYEFAKRNGIPAFCTNMFISELGEAYFMGLRRVSTAMIEESNTSFVRALSSCIHLSPQKIHDYMMKSEYAQLAENNPVAAYNFKRLNYNPVV